jgi:hypothetical protein
MTHPDFSRADLKRASALIVMWLWAAPIMAQESRTATADPGEPGFLKDIEVSGFVDIYYTYNFNTPLRPCATSGGVAIFNCLRNFDVAHNSFSLNLAEVALEKKPTGHSRGGFRLDLDYGPAASIVHAAEPGGTAVYQNIQQAYVSYLAPVGTGLQFDVGKFVSPLGNEVIETKDNWNYSRSLLFTLAVPYYHMGLRAAYSPNNKVTLAGYLVNGWNNVVDNNTGKTVGGSITFKPVPAVTVSETYIGGPEQTNDNTDWRHVADTIASVTVNKHVTLAANYDYGQDSVMGKTLRWQGIAGYVRYQPIEWFALTPRAEYYNDKDGVSTGTRQRLKETTVTLELKKDGVITRFEYRRDYSDVPFFLKNISETTMNQDTFTIGFVYAFSSKAP